MERMTLKSNVYADPSHMRQYLGALLYHRGGILAPTTLFARVKINEVYMGLYTLVHDLTARELHRRVTGIARLRSITNTEYLPLNSTTTSTTTTTTTTTTSITTTTSFSSTPSPITIDISAQSGSDTSASSSMYTYTLARAVDNRAPSHKSEVDVRAGDIVFVLLNSSVTGSPSDAPASITADSAYVVHAKDVELAGIVPLSVLQPIACGDSEGTLLEPMTTLQFYHPHSFVPADGMPTYPWHLHSTRLYAALHNDTARISHPSEWRASLEQVLDVRDGPSSFLNWLATNVVTGNWNTYGVVPHNFKFYADSCTGRISVFMDDFEHIFDARSHDLSLLYPSVGSDWPLLRFIIDDDVYRSVYLHYVQQMIEKIFPQDEKKGTLSIELELKELFSRLLPHIDPESPLGENEDVSQIDIEASKETAKGLGKEINARRKKIAKQLKSLLGKAMSSDRVKKDEKMQEERPHNSSKQKQGGKGTVKKTKAREEL